MAALASALPKPCGLAIARRGWRALTQTHHVMSYYKKAQYTQQLKQALRRSKAARYLAGLVYQRRRKTARQKGPLRPKKP